MPVKHFWRGLSLRGKFGMLAGIGILIWLSNFSITYFEIRGINRATLDLEKYEDLYNTVLEIRRYEKNYLLYRERGDLVEAVGWFHNARRMLAELPVASGGGRHGKERDALAAAMKRYGASLFALEEPFPARSRDESVQEKIRVEGKRIVDLSYGLLAGGKRQVTSAAHRALRWPLISTGLILALFALGVFLVNRKIVQPLTLLEKATTKIGRGDFGPIHHPGLIESEVDHLILAFNRMAEELEASQEQIVHTRKIASLGTLVSGVAHELNNPINNIILTIDSLTGGRKITDERRQALLEDILTQAIRASGIVKNLLDFSRSETTLVEDLELGKILRETIQISENQIVINNIKLEVEIAPDLPTVKGNRQALQQVFINLLTNAVHAMPAGGQLQVRAATEFDGKISITVRDSGNGISEEHLPYIFDPFFTTKEVGQGTGLGLSVSYGIIKKHGGRITVESAPGSGEYVFHLPAGQRGSDPWVMPQCVWPSSTTRRSPACAFRNTWPRRAFGWSCFLRGPLFWRRSRPPLTIW